MKLLSVKGLKLEPDLDYYLMSWIACGGTSFPCMSSAQRLSDYNAAMCL